MTRHSRLTRITALVLAALTAGTAMVPVCAAPIDDGVTPIYDEAYYATLDYYGNLTQGSVVKSYTLNGASSLTDYGVYDQVVNLTDGTVPTSGSGRTAFQFDQAPDHFYFEGKTSAPFQNLPWTITLRYTLNGVPARAEELAGKTGVVEILLDLVPNEGASDYARYNYTLAAAAMFNQDDILSLEAPGAQVQLVGNLRTVLFMALPGEEQHFTIRVGSDSFAFEGMTFLMMPATLAQLEEINKLSQRKDDLEEDYRALSGSLDNLLDALNDSQGGLYASAKGLDQLNTARGTISNGKGLIYDEAGVLRGDLSNIAGLLEPVEQRAQTLSQTITDSQAVLNTMTDSTVLLQERLKELENALAGLESGTSDVQDLLESAADMKESLDALASALGGVSISTGGSSVSGTATVKKVREVHSVYETARSGNRQAAFAGLMELQGADSSNAAQAAQLAQALEQGASEEQIIALQTKEQIFAHVPGVTEENYAAILASPAGMAIQAQVSQTIRAQLPSVRQLEALYQAASSLSFQQFCEKLPGVSKEQAKQMNDLWLIESGGKQAQDIAAPALSAAVTAMGTGVMPAALAGSMFVNAAAIAGIEVQDEEPPVQEESPAEPPEQESPEQPPESETPETPDEIPDTSDENQSAGSAAVDLIAGGLDSANEKINQIQRELSSTLDRITNPTARVVRDLASLCAQLDDLVDLLDDAADTSAALRKASQQIRDILGGVDALRLVLNDCEPVLQEALANVGSLSTSAVTTIRDLNTLLADAEALMKTSGDQLDAGTRQSLQGLSAALRQTAKALAATGDVRDAKTTITDIIEDTWNEYTGDVNNILLMDAGAEPVSLTDSRNPAPSSIQILIRTQEIKEEDAKNDAETVAVKEQTTFWDRVAQMFRDFWNAITGVFH